MMEERNRIRASVLVVHDGKILGFLGEDPTSKKRMFFLPGGGIEPGETPDQTVIREALEETGYRIRVLGEPGAFKNDYPFIWDGVLYHCTTWWYRAVLDPATQTPPAVNDSAYHLGVRWLDLADVETAFDYSEPIKTAVRKLLEQ